MVWPLIVIEVLVIGAWSVGFVGKVLVRRFLASGYIVVISGGQGLAVGDLKASTRESYERNLRRHVIPSIGHLQLQALTSTGLNAFYSGQDEDGVQRIHPLQRQETPEVRR